MKNYRCDGCNQEISQEHHMVRLTGVSPIKGGKILLVDNGWKLDFCNPDCFWAWVEGQVAK